MKKTLLAILRGAQALLPFVFIGLLGGYFFCYLLGSVKK